MQAIKNLSNTSIFFNLLLLIDWSVVIKSNNFIFCVSATMAWWILCYFAAKEGNPARMNVSRNLNYFLKKIKTINTYVSRKLKEGCPDFFFILPLLEYARRVSRKNIQFLYYNRSLWFLLDQKKKCQKLWIKHLFYFLRFEFWSPIKNLIYLYIVYWTQTISSRALVYIIMT